MTSIDWGQCCKTCRFWHQERECHRFPPVIIARYEAIDIDVDLHVKLRSHDADNGPIGGFWPATSANSWCGEWVPERSTPVAAPSCPAPPPSPPTTSSPSTRPAAR